MVTLTMLAVRVRMDQVVAKLANREIFPSLRTPTSEVDVVDVVDVVAAAVSIHLLLLMTKAIR
jgi:hypothetical protein